MGCEGIEPLVVHPACFGTTALQAAAGNTTQSSNTGGSRTYRPRRFELRRFAGVRTVPSQRPRWDLNPRLHRDRVASIPGCSARTDFSPIAQVGLEPTASLVLSQGGLPVAYRAAVVPDGVEPSFPGCGPSVVAVGPRDRVFQVESPGVAPGTDAKRWSAAGRHVKSGSTCRPAASPRDGMPPNLR